VYCRWGRRPLVEVLAMASVAVGVAAAAVVVFVVTAVLAVPADKTVLAPVSSE